MPLLPQIKLIMIPQISSSIQSLFNFLLFKIKKSLSLVGLFSDPELCEGRGSSRLTSADPSTQQGNLQASPGAPRSPSRSPGDSAGKKGPLVRSVSALQGSTPREREPTLAWPLKQRRSPHSTAVLEPEGLQNCLFLAAV